MELSPQDVDHATAVADTVVMPTQKQQNALSQSMHLMRGPFSFRGCEPFLLLIPLGLSVYAEPHPMAEAGYPLHRRRPEPVAAIHTHRAHGVPTRTFMLRLLLF